MDGPRDVIWISWTADAAGYHDPSQLRVVAVETTVEVDHGENALVIGVLDYRRSLCEVQVNGLLAQHREVRHRGASGVAGMGVGG
jgi:hypothetical protein